MSIDEAAAALSQDPQTIAKVVECAFAANFEGDETERGRAGIRGLAEYLAQRLLELLGRRPTDHEIAYAVGCIGTALAGWGEQAKAVN